MKKKSLLSRLLSKTPGAGEESSEKREFVAEQLEARILYSAAPVEVEAPQVDQEVVVDDNSSADFESADSFAEGEIPAVNSSASSGELVTLTSFDHLSSQEIESLANAAVERWKEADLTAEQIEALEAIEISMVDMEGFALGETEGTEIFLDWNAAGRDWFIDETPFDDDEFEFAESSTAFRDTDGDAQYGIDMLTVMMHEMGHVLGLEDIYQSAQDLNLMHWDLDEGQRITPVHGQAHGADPLSLEGVHQLNAVNPTGGDAAARGDALEADINTDLEAMLSTGVFNDTTEGTSDPDYEINLDAGQTYAINQELLLANRTINVVINGNGATIDAQNLVRAFRIIDDSNVTINDLTIINGQHTADGGGMWIDNSNVTLNNVTFQDNVVTADGNSQGAALYAQGHSTTITLSGTVNFIDNFAKGDGGAMAVGQHVVVDGSAATAINFTGNRSGWDGTAADPDEHGGAIWAFEHAQLTLNNATLDGNSASGNGGAIYISNSADIIFSADTSTSLQNNYAEDDGGGIYMTDASTVNLGVVDIKGNTAFLGNGGGFRTSHQENVVTITGGTLENNTAGISDNDGSGGGFWNQGTVNIKGVDIQNNLAYNSGGAFYNAYNNSVVNLEDVNILSNTAEDNAGGFRADDGTIIFTNVLNTETKISGNRVGVDLDAAGAETAILDDKSGGGFYANRRSVVSIANGIIQDNTSSGHGAGFWASDESTVTITDGNILSNEIAPTIANNDERGGGFWVSGDATVNLDATDVTDNTAARQGGGFFVGGESATVNINDADISGNTGNNGLQSGVYGGGFYAEGSVNLTSVNITGNKVIGEGGEDNHGGGFATAGHGAVITGTDVNIIGNEAWTHGGGWYGADGTVNLTGGTISGNFVSGEGGTLTGDNNSNGVGAAAYLVGEGNAILNNVTVENHVSESHGGAFYVTNRHFLHLNGGILQNNMAGIKDITDAVHGIGTVIVDGTDGGGFYATEDARVRIQGTTITGNVAEDEGGGFMIASDRTLLQIDSATIDKNTASSGGGGGFRNAGTVVFTGEGTVNITNNVTLQGNDATADNVGGGFYSSGGSSLMVTGTLDNGVTGTGRDLTNGTAKINIAGNTAFGRGGGFYLSDGDIDLRGTAAGDINVSQNGISTNANVGGEKRGGGFWVSGGGRGANVRIDNGTIANNFTPNDGGGFYTRDGATVVLNETDILNNTAESLEINRGGGGFHADYSEDHIIITGGKIEGNVAGANNTADTRVRGGGFYTSGKVELHGGVQVLNNEVASSTTAGADRRGGGAALDNTGWIHTTDATFDGNKSFNVGAGIYNEGKITATGTGLSVLNSSFTATDQRREGAGVYFTGSSSADWDGGTIDGNVSTWHGGGVRITGSADVKFTNVTISNNKTVHHATDTDTNAIGGGIYASGPTQLTMIDSLVTSNTAEGRGGGFYIDDTTVTLVNTDVTNNYAGVTYDAANDTMNALLTANGNAVNREGGGFWLNNQANMTVTGGEISGNVAWQGGGLELRNDAKATFDGVGIQDNVAHNGGGFRSYEDAEIVFQNNSKIANNFSFNGNGGGFYIGTRVEVQLSDTTIDGNISEDHAGGIYAANDAKIFAERTTISNNLAGYEYDGKTLGPDADRRGGAMWLSNNAEVHFIDSTISGNEAHEFGGAINMENDSVLSAVGSLFSDNIAGNYGGAIRYASNAQVDLTNTTVSGNYAGFNRAVNGNGSITVDENNRVGGGIWSQSDGNVGNFTHVTITDNYSTAGSGAGLYKSGAGTINIEGSIIFDNQGDADATPIASDTVNEMNLVGENIIGAHGGSALVGNTAGRSTVDPVLIALTDNGGPTETHAFVSGSSAENGAASSAAELDQRSGIRVDADLGAFELGAALPTVTVANVERLTHGPVGEIATFTVTVSASGTV
ncbi:MAG: right-handed parallel beta-helix repeat-containing protein, partial [Verrucomicrobiales bacterium]|nr:right-handed parallel beta-helix repeat-containing protein [Verrucomicrobiales bacterium]